MTAFSCILTLSLVNMVTTKPKGIKVFKFPYKITLSQFQQNYSILRYINFALHVPIKGSIPSNRK